MVMIRLDIEKIDTDDFSLENSYHRGSAEQDAEDAKLDKKQNVKCTRRLGKLHYTN